MKIKVAQVKYRNADFIHNFYKIVDAFDHSADLTIYPEIDVTDAMDFDSNYRTNKEEFYEKIAKHFSKSTLLVGQMLFKKGKIFDTSNAFFECEDKKFYVSDEYKDNIDCDIYILEKNSYYTMNSHKNLLENIVPTTNFIFVNSIMLEGENVYAGQSFAKNSNNELVEEFGILEETSKVIDFENKITPKTIETEEEIYKVTTFAIREYCNIIGFKKVLLGLSGGIDSALTAVLAAEAMGSKNVDAIMLPSKYSSKGSITDSEKLAKKLDINIKKTSIEPLFNCFMENAGNGYRMDLAEENLQSRLRGVILMFESNREGSLLLSTGNKSEVACGYGTLYGDMCGGLNVIADLTKTNVYKLSNWINRNEEIIPKEIIKKAPSAELRPNQKDQDSLPEYDLLDKIIEDYIENQISYGELTEKYDPETVDKTLQLIYKAQFKRNQACQGIRLTENAFCANVKLPVLQNCY